MIEVNVTIPNPITWPQVEVDLIAANDKTVDKAKRLLDTTKANFSARSQFDFVVTPSQHQGDVIEGKVETDNINYVRLNEGTPPRPRAAKTPRGMSFRYTYTARTKPRSLGSGQSSRSGRWVSGIQNVVSGPIVAREFDKTAAAAVEKDHLANVNAVLAKHFGGKP